MSKEIKVFIAEDNEYYLSSLGAYFQTQKNIEVVDTAKNVLEIINKINKIDVDVIILDIDMLELNCIEVLQFIVKNSPICIILSESQNDNLIIQAMCLGAKYYFKKPFEMGELAKVIKELINDNDEKTISNLNNDMLKLEVKVTKIIHKLQIPAHIKGYRFLRDGIIMTVKDDRVIGQVTKLLYPELARKYKTTPSRVERSMRSAIEIAWDRSELNVLKEIFGYTPKTLRKRPTNSEFISTIADILRIEMLKEIDL